MPTVGPLTCGRPNALPTWCILTLASPGITIMSGVFCMSVSTGPRKNRIAEPAMRDEAAIRGWQKRHFPQIARRARERGAHLVFLDESGFMLTPTVRRTWAPRGQTPDLSCWDRRDRLSVISCITVSPKAGRLNLYFEILKDNANAHGEDIVSYLRQLKQQLGAPFTVIWDGSKIHSRSGAVKAYLAKHPEIQAKTLPGYAPDLNPDEGVWGWCKYGRLANLAAYNTTHLRVKITHELDSLKRNNKKLLTSFVKETGLTPAA